MHLFIPKSSINSLKQIRKDFKNDVLAARVIIFEIEPFVFLQGVVFAGTIEKFSNAKIQVKSKGYYLYKPILQEQDSFPNDGIFVDVSAFNKTHDFSIAIESYYRFLRKNFNITNGYTFSAKVNYEDNEDDDHQYVSKKPYKLSDV